MHALVAAILPRLAGGNALRHHAGFDQFHRQPGQAASAARGKRRAVIRAQVVRQPELAEDGVEHQPDMIGVRAPQVLAAQQIAAMGIAERQRFAPPAVMAYCSRT